MFTAYRGEPVLSNICAHFAGHFGLRGWSRYRAIRWLRENAVCMCAAHHLYYTHHPLEWEDFCIGLRGPTRYDELRRMGLNDPPMDPFDVIERLSGASTGS